MKAPLPDIRDLGHGMSVIPVPLPFPSPAWVNCYVIATSTSVTLIDCGVSWDRGMDRLREGFDRLGIDPTSVDRLIVSHLHPDHVGMAPRVTDEFECELVMHRNAATRYAVYNDRHAFRVWIDEFGQTHGVPAGLLGAFTSIERPDWLPDIGPPDRVVDDGDRIDIGDGRVLEILHTPGHEHAHICLVESRTGILFSGDHILPRITPVIMWDATGEDVLGLYLSSVGRLAEGTFGLTYPAHGLIVERGSARAEQIGLHHERRLSGMLDVVTLGPTTAWDVMLESFRPHLNAMEQRLALRETVSHLEHLRNREQLTSFDETVADSMVRFYRLG